MRIITTFTAKMIRRHADGRVNCQHLLFLKPGNFKLSKVIGTVLRLHWLSLYLSNWAKVSGFLVKIRPKYKNSDKKLRKWKMFAKFADGLSVFVAYTSVFVGKIASRYLIQGSLNLGNSRKVQEEKIGFEAHAYIGHRAELIFWTELS